jgi:AmiR/NasT family two-component response regulator
MRVLVADDEALIRLGLKSMLEELDHEVITAADGREAIQQVLRLQPDIAILDIKMPYTDGLQAAETLSRSRPLPILLLTALSDEEMVDRASDLPIHGYLVKPIRVEALSAAMTVAVKRFEEAQELKMQADELEERLETRLLLDRAKAKLMAGGLDEEAAYKTIQRRARESRQSMAQVARDILRE